MSDQPESSGSAREDEDDLDLLTFTEVGIRLDEEIARTRAAIAAIDPATADADEATRPHQARLEALLAARQRNGRSALDIDSFERLFGYRAETMPQEWSSE
jgi:hypothetical protein